MIRRITLINFMSHEHTVLDLSDGVNVLLGPNNCGKSAIVEAIRAVSENSRGSYMIRHGESECQVIIETGEGDVIHWRRKKKSASYVINGEEIHRGRVPDELDSLLRMSQVEVRDGNESFNVHLGEQKTPIFLVDEPGSKVATFFASASDAHYLVQMQEQHRQNVREKKNLLGTLQEQVTKNDATLKKYRPLVAMEKQLVEFRDQRGKLVADSEGNRQQRLQLEELRGKQEERERLQQSKQLLESLQSPPLEFPVLELSGRLNELGKRAVEMVLRTQRMEVLEQLRQPPEMEDLAELTRQVSSYANATRQSLQAQQQQAEAEEKLEACREELRVYASQQPTCPQCHRPWSEEELLELLEKGESHDA
tara:strand:- start:558 stop:1655 length:1098 start_codon:yes stop_codon:yes gene_type:complete